MENYNKIWIALMIVVSSAMPSLAQSRVKLDSVLKVIERQNPRLKSISARAGSLTAYAKGAQGWTAPEVGGGLWMVPYRKTDDARDKGQIMVSVQQKITNPAKLRANQKYLDSKSLIEAENEHVVFNELRAAARTAWYAWAVLEKKNQLLMESQSIISLMITTAKQRYPYRQEKMGDIFKADARLAEIQNTMVMNAYQISQKNILIDQMMNVSPAFRFQIDTALRTYMSLPEAVDSSELALQRSDLRRIERTIQSTVEGQALERTQARPDFSLSFSHMIPRGSGMPSQFMLLGMVSIPIAPWSSKTYKANIEGMSRELDALRSERTAVMHEANAAASALYGELVALHQQLDNYDKRIIPALKKNYDVTVIAYNENTADLSSVLEALETWNASRFLYLDTLNKYFESLADLGLTNEN